MAVGPAGSSVLVTGGAGFIGSHLAAALIEANEVRILDDLSNGRSEYVPDGAQLITNDIRNETVCRHAMEGIDVVFHLAARTDVNESVGDPRRCHSVNMRGTLNVLEVAREFDIRVILASSAAIYGEPQTVPIDESHPSVPQSPYGLAKLSADHAARLFFELYDLPTVVLRYFNVYGQTRTGSPGSGVVGAFVDRALAGEPLPIHGDGQQTRDFVHVDDVVTASLRAATSNQLGEAFNIGSGTQTAIRELAEMVREVVSPDIPIRQTSSRDGDIRHSRADITAAAQALDFTPAVELQRGIESICSSDGRNVDTTNR